MSESAAAGAATHPASGHTAWAKTIAGQCHRYQLYERSPIHTSGPDAHTVVIDGSRSVDPAAMSSTVPTTGSAAA